MDLTVYINYSFLFLKEINSFIQLALIKLIKSDGKYISYVTKDSYFI